MEYEVTHKPNMILVFLEMIFIYFTVKYFHYYRLTYGMMITLYIILNDQIRPHFKIYIILWVLMNLFCYKKNKQSIK